MAPREVCLAWQGLERRTLFRLRPRRRGAGLFGRSPAAGLAALALLESALGQSGTADSLELPARLVGLAGPRQWQVVKADLVWDWPLPHWAG